MINFEKWHGNGNDFVIDALKNGQTKYTPVDGTPDLKQAIASRRTAPASYMRFCGSEPFPCKIIIRLRAVIAMNKGRSIGIRRLL